jgi:hypothetical protein
MLSLQVFWDGDVKMETLTVELIAFFVICGLLMAISVYKVVSFYKKDDNAKKILKYRKYVHTLPFIKRMIYSEMLSL